MNIYTKKIILDDIFITADIYCDGEGRKRKTWLSIPPLPFMSESKHIERIFKKAHKWADNIIEVLKKQEI